MKYADLKRKVLSNTKNSLINPYGYSFTCFVDEYNILVNKKIITYLNYCIDKKIPLELTEKDYLEIMNICISLKIKDLNKFLNEIENICSNKINYFKLLELLEKNN